MHSGKEAYHHISELPLLKKVYLVQISNIRLYYDKKGAYCKNRDEFCTKLCVL